MVHFGQTDLIEKWQLNVSTVQF